MRAISLQRNIDNTQVDCVSIYPVEVNLECLGLDFSEMNGPALPFRPGGGTCCGEERRLVTDEVFVDVESLLLVFILPGDNGDYVKVVRPEATSEICN